MILLSKNLGNPRFAILAVIIVDLVLSTSCSQSTVYDRPSPSTASTQTIKPSWASAVGDDQYGHWADLTVKGVAQRMRWIASGHFTMGCSAQEVEWAFTEITKLGWDGPKRDMFSDVPAHAVTLTTGFWLADSSCSQKMWLAVMGNNPSKFTGSVELPVETVSFKDVQAFLRAAHVLTGTRLALPSEAQWEYACRAGTTTRYSFGDDPEKLVLYANIADQDYKTKYYDRDRPNFPFLAGHDGFAETAPVKSFRPNLWGLYDMNGNVFQWCADWYGDYTSTSITDPVGPPAGSNRVARGGCWFSAASYCRSAYRFGSEPHDRDSYLGFRFLVQSNEQ
jgi:sulfatase modifying factor 1